jgi:hypothetical protein
MLCHSKAFAVYISSGGSSSNSSSSSSSATQLYRPPFKQRNRGPYRSSLGNDEAADAAVACIELQQRILNVTTLVPAVPNAPLHATATVNTEVPYFQLLLSLCEGRSLH